MWCVGLAYIWALNYLADQIIDDFLHLKQSSNLIQLAKYTLLISDVLEWLSDRLGSSTSVQDVQTGLTLLEDIGRRALRTNTVLMVDAEYTYINPALTALTLAFALRCNKDKAIVWNTTQCYLKVTSSLLPMMFIALTNSLIIFLL